MAQQGKNPLLTLQDYGQSVWLDYIRRNMLKSGGDLARLIEQDGLRGMTANPTIFQQAIAAGDDYDETIQEMVGKGAEPQIIYEALASDDIRHACDLFRPLYDRTRGADGFVSLEVAPSLAHDTDGTINEARRFWKMVDRPNLMIKVPGTAEGVPAVEQLLVDGLNINITLLFSIQNYERVARTYVDALERRAGEGKPLDRIASVASFFVSRIDTLVDQKIEERLGETTEPTMRAHLEGLRGTVAVANARLAYRSFKQIFGDERWGRLQGQGARVQRPLWASTSVKNKAYPDLLYVDNLIGPDTVNTMPRETLEAFRDHGNPQPSIEKDVEGAQRTLQTMAEVGIEYDAVTAQLEDEGIDKFAKSFDELIEGIMKKHQVLETPAGSRS